MINAANNKPYSATVSLILHVNENEYELAKTGPSRVFLRTPVELPPCDGTLSINIDGNITTEKVRLPNGASIDSAGVTIEHHE